MQKVNRRIVIAGVATLYRSFAVDFGREISVKGIGRWRFLRFINHPDPHCQETKKNHPNPAILLRSVGNRFSMAVLEFKRIEHKKDRVSNPTNVRDSKPVCVVSHWNAPSESFKGPSIGNLYNGIC